MFRLHEFTMAVFICNDSGSFATLPRRLQKADIFVTIFNSSQGSMGTDFSNIESWEVINNFYSRVFGIYNICANRVGEEAWKKNVSLQAVETAKIGAERGKVPR